MNWKVGICNDKYMWQFESNLLNINVDDKLVALGLAWPWPGLKVKAKVLIKRPRPKVLRPRP